MYEHLGHHSWYLTDVPFGEIRLPWWSAAPLGNFDINFFPGNINISLGGGRVSHVNS